MAEELRRINNEVGRSIVSKQAYLLWIHQRRDTLLERLSAHDVLRHFGVNLKFEGSSREEQICCPFHEDSTPSARVYETQGKSKSGLYCYTCRKRWDIFKLWGEFKGDPDMKFMAKLYGLERAFGFETPEPPTREDDIDYTDFKTDEEAVELEKTIGLLDVCERCLRDNRSCFMLDGFLLLGQALDRLHYQVARDSIELSKAQLRSRQILAKIREKVLNAEAAQDQNS